jgi:hypothetical protein
MDNLSKYVENISFISWVSNPTGELDLIWKEFCANHPEENRNVHATKRIIAQFRTVAEPLPGNHRIRKIDSEGNVTAFGESPNNPGYADDQGTAAKFSLPYDLDVDADRNLYVCVHGSHMVNRIKS